MTGKRLLMSVCLGVALVFALGAVASATPPEIVKKYGLIERTHGLMMHTPQKKGYKKAPPYIVGFSDIGVLNSWRQQTTREVESAVGQHKDLIKEYIKTDANGAIPKQIADIQDLMAKGVDILIVTPASPTALNPVLEKAYKAGIMVVVFNSNTTTENVSAKLFINQWEFGRHGGEWLVKALGGKGKVVALSGLAGNSISELRFGGAKWVFDQHPGIEVVGRAYGNWAYDKGKVAMENLMSAHPQIDGIWSGGGAMTRGAIDAYLEAGRKLVPMTGEANNGFLRQWKELAPKGFDSVAPVEPTWQGAMALEIGLAARMGLPYYKYNNVPSFVVTKENMDQVYRPDLDDFLWLDYHLTEEMLQKYYKRK